MQEFAEVGYILRNVNWLVAGLVLGEVLSERWGKLAASRSLWPRGWSVTARDESAAGSRPLCRIAAHLPCRALSVFIFQVTVLNSLHLCKCFLRRENFLPGKVCVWKLWRNWSVKGDPNPHPRWPWVCAWDAGERASPPCAQSPGRRKCACRCRFAPCCL